MSAVTIAAIWIWAAGISQAREGECTELNLKALDVMERLIASGEASAVARGKRIRPDALEPCSQLALARVAVVGFEEARALAAFGGELARQGPTRDALELLAKLHGGSLELEVEYAATAIRAAISAAQDERPELDLFLTHARDLTERLASRQRRAVWPRPFNVLAGELWFEVDRFDEARAAFERAVAVDGSPIAIAGLARAFHRLGRRDEACRTFALLPADAVSLRELYRQDFAGCR